ncbi:MAG: hypothetical protein R2705_11855 [Ilumatobacteraceae bacterium]
MRCLGAVSDAMLLGHWYLVQPGLPRRLLHELVDALASLAHRSGGPAAPDRDDQRAHRIDRRRMGWDARWFWLACAVATIVLVGVTKAALKERAYSAVMAATGPALPRHPHRARHRSGGPGRAGRPTVRRSHEATDP